MQEYPDESNAQDLIISDVQNMGIQDISPDEKAHIDVSTSDASGKTLDQFVSDYKLSGTISDKEYKSWISSSDSIHLQRQ